MRAQFLYKYFLWIASGLNRSNYSAYSGPAFMVYRLGT